MNPDLLKTGEHPSKRISDLVRTDPEIRDLTVGEPGYAPPAIFIDSFRRLLADGSSEPSAAHNRYTSSSGAPTLREEIAKYYRRLHNLVVDPDSDVLVTNGAAEALWLCIFSLTSSGDEVILSDPTYSIYGRAIQALGRIPVYVEASEKHNWQMDASQVAAVVSDKTRLIILNSPQNPMGELYSSQALLSLIRLAVHYDLYLVHDEVFDCMIFRGEHTSAATFLSLSQKIVTVNSFSKRFGMTGWRIGWVMASPTVTTMMAKAHTLSSLACPTAAQIAAAVALNDPTANTEMRANVLEVERRSKLVHAEMAKMQRIGVSKSPPSAGFYLFTKIDKLAERLDPALHYETRGEAVAAFLLEVCKVAVVPGIAFGRGGSDFIRVSFAGPEDALMEGIDRIRRAVERL